MAAPIGLVASGMFAERGRNRELGQRDRQIGLQERRLGLEEQQMQADSQAKQRAAVQKNVGDLLGLVDQTAQAVIQRAEDQGLDRDAVLGQVEQQVAPLVQRAALLAQASGDPTLALQVQGAMTRLQSYRSRSDVMAQDVTSAAAKAGAVAAAEAPFKRPPVTNVNVTNMGEIETAGQKELAKLSGQRVAQLREAAGRADKTLIEIRRARQLLDKVETGQLAGVELVIKRFLKGVGFDLEQLGLDNNTGPAEALQSLGLSFALQRVQETVGPISNTEMQLFAQAAPGLARTREGNLLILELGEALAQRTQEAARAVNKHLSNGGRIQDVDMVIQDYFDSNPLMTTDDVQNRIRTALEAPVVGALPQQKAPNFRKMAEEAVTAEDIYATARNSGKTPQEILRKLREQGATLTREAARIGVAE